MEKTRIHQFSLQRPRLSLCCYFVAWKLLLILVALASPGPGYDTSTSLALEPVFSSATQSIVHETLSKWNITLKLTRWDALYFTKIAHAGYVFEQEWMAGFGFTKILGFLSNYDTSLPQMALASLIGICLAHVSHLLSVLVLYDLSLLSLGGFSHSKSSVMALLAACFHIISPAGMFLSAPYAESLFSLMTFLGFYLYGISLSASVETCFTKKVAFLLCAGLCLGLATTIRANGLLNGSIFVYEFVTSAFALTTSKSMERNREIAHICAAFCAGALMGCISIFPQYVAYVEYCLPLSKRPWCSRLIPSIYTWIQSEYWYVEIYLVIPQQYLLREGGLVS